MKTIIVLSLFVFGSVLVMNGQVDNKPKKEISVKDEHEKPGKWPVPFHQLITSQQWRGARIWYPPNAATVDSVLSVVFNVDNTVTWNKQGWEHVPRMAGTYKVRGNRITIDFIYFPYTHHLTGTYNTLTGKITGSFSEIKALDPAAPPAYVSEKIQGEFNFYKK